VSPKSLVLAAAAVAVIAMGVYLFVQVRSTPAQASGSAAIEPATPHHDQVAEARQPELRDHGSPSATQAKPAKRGIQTPQATPDPGLDPVEPTTDPAAQKVDLKSDNLMELANKAYDRQDFDEATALAGKLLAKDPTNIRMLRIMVSASCIQGDSLVAQQHFEKLPQFDREQMKQRCDRYGVTFKDP
jgi:hypothetical protein